MKRPIEQRQETLLSFLAVEISKQQAANLLGCTLRTIENYRKQYKEEGHQGLIDHRHSNNHKLTQKQSEEVIQLKKNDRWRSARNIRDKLRLPVDQKQVQRVLTKAGLTKENTKMSKSDYSF